MTNTKFRKKALLSSVAMLLVALVALGSATFAWFVANPSVSATGIKMETKAAPGILVASKSALALDPATGQTKESAYKSSTVLDAKTGTCDEPVANTAAHTVSPVAPDTTPTSNALSFYTAKAADSAHSTISSTPSWTAANDAVYSDIIYFRASNNNETGPTIKSASVTITLSTEDNTIKNGVKVALVSSSNELIGIWRPDTGSNQKTYASGALTDSAYTCTVSGQAKNLASAISTSYAVNNTTFTTDNYITVYVYLDGEDQYAFSDNAATLKQLVSQIVVSVSTVAVSGS